MTIILHIGTHKTGTTAIQHFLGKHRYSLRQKGIWYPDEADLLPSGKEVPTHLSLARSLDCTGKPKVYSQDQLSIMAKNLVKKSEDYDTTIISAEAFWRIGFGRPTGKGKNDDELWSNKDVNISRIRSLLAGSNTRVVAVLRERSRYIQSSYNEFVLATLYSETIQCFQRTYSHVFDYNAQLKAWQHYFPVQALSYEHLCSNQVLPTNFLQAVCGDVKLNELNHEDARSRANISQPIPCVFLKRYLNKATISHETRAKLYNKLRKRFGRQKSRSLEQLRCINSWMTAKQLTRLRLKYRQDDDALRSTWNCHQMVSAESPLSSAEKQSLQPMKQQDELLSLGWFHSQFPVSSKWFHDRLDSRDSN